MTISQIDYNSATAGIINYLAANSTTIDNNMYASLTTIEEFRVDEKSLYSNKYPAISVDLVSSTDERTEIGVGSNARRIVTCTWEIGCHVRQMASYTAVVQSMRRLVGNVEHAIRITDTFSNTVNEVRVTNVEFGNIIRGENGNWQKNGKIDIETDTYI